MLINDANTTFIYNKKSPDPIVVEKARDWYKRFTGKQYLSNDINELVEIYTSLQETI